VTSQDEELLGDLLLRWEELREQGIDPPAGELAGGRIDLIPELDRRIHMLAAASWLDRPLAATAANAGDRQMPDAAEPVARTRRDRWLSAAVTGCLLCGGLVLWLHRQRMSAAPLPVIADDALLDAAETAFFNANYAAAAERYTRVLERSPDHGRALSARGICRLKLGRYDEAVADLTTALRLAPEDRESRRQRAQANLFLRRYATAISDLERLLELEPEGGAIRGQIAAIRAVQAAAGDEDATGPSDGTPAMPQAADP